MCVILWPKAGFHTPPSLLYRHFVPGARQWGLLLFSVTCLSHVDIMVMVPQAIRFHI
jgi:hypothetical protein